MGILTISEAMLSRSVTQGANPSAELVCTAWSTDDDALVRSEVAAAVAAQYAVDGKLLNRQSITTDPVFVDTVNHRGIWKATIRYGAKDPPAGTFTFQFDTGGSTQHITQSIANVSRTGLPGKTPPDCGGAVGVAFNGPDISVAGCDIVVPVFNWSETHVLEDSQVQACKANYYALTGKVNGSTWRGYAAGEVLLLGVSGSTRGDGKWELTFRFAASPNKTSFQVGGITVPAKKGWEYMWIMYADKDDSAAKKIVKSPVAAYVEKVYEEGSLAALGIGS